MRENRAKAAMDPWRRSLAKHYCRACGMRAKRLRMPFWEGMVWEVVTHVVLGFFALVLAGSLQGRAGVSSGAAWMVSLIVLGLFLFPVADRIARYRCSGCSRRYSVDEMRSEGSFSR